MFPSHASAQKQIFEESEALRRRKRRERSSEIEILMEKKAKTNSRTSFHTHGKKASARKGAGKITRISKKVLLAEMTQTAKKMMSHIVSTQHHQLDGLNNQVTTLNAKIAHWKKKCQQLQKEVTQCGIIIQRVSNAGESSSVQISKVKTQTVGTQVGPQDLVNCLPVDDFQLSRNFILPAKLLVDPQSSTRPGSFARCENPPSQSICHPSLDPSSVMFQARPPKPWLKIFNSLAVPSEIILHWDMVLTNVHAEILAYWIFVCRGSSAQTKPHHWRKVMEWEAQKLPMLCKVANLVDGEKYCFAVCSVDVHQRGGPLSEGVCVTLISNRLYIFH